MALKMSIGVLYLLFLAGDDKRLMEESIFSEDDEYNDSQVVSVVVDLRKYWCWVTEGWREAEVATKRAKQCLAHLHPTFQRMLVAWCEWSVEPSKF